MAKTKRYASAASLFRAEYGKSRNMITPDVLAYAWIVRGRIAYELSEGTDFHHKPIFGVSVAGARDDGSTFRFYDPVSAVFNSRAAAMAHVRELKDSPPSESAEYASQRSDG